MMKNTAQLEPLPKGRHGLSREEVAASQQTRLVQAAVELGLERGFASLTLTDIVGRAHVARSTFYEHFDDKEQCFLAAFDHAADLVLKRVLVLGRQPSDASGSLGDLYIARFLELCRDEPAMVRLVAADASILGPATAERQREMKLRLATGLVTLREALRRSNPELQPLTPLRALAFVGAVIEVLRHTLPAEGVDGIPDLQEEFTTILIALMEARPRLPRGLAC